MKFFALCALLLSLSFARPAEAAILYEFSLPATGSYIPAFTIQVELDSFVTSSTAPWLNLESSSITMIGSIPFLSLSDSRIRIVADGANTTVHLQLCEEGCALLLTTGANEAYPFVFTRGESETGSFSAAAVVYSDSQLFTPNVTGTLQVTDTAPVPEPATLSLVGAGLVGAAVWRKRQR
ncbi:PEP-CTERM sorting domain-containing protein [Bryobacter aggregatus]|uniref:PEP-CTERM sorting domain-containing protein n=1 Tax=Bryobacter aggregatus TaxID=360054 RepID=UPI0004E249D1|nr:PEP-CTERM sorting domain-containing protein [Bryobacter aggregatus]